MPGDGISKKNVVFHGTCPDIVEDPGPALRGLPVRDDPDVRQIPRQHPRDQITGLVVFGTLRYRQFCTGSLEKLLQVRHPAVVDIFIRPTESPHLRIRGELSFHVLVHQDLKIDTDRTIRADDQIRAHAPVIRHISHRVADDPIRPIVNLALTGSRPSRLDKVPCGLRRTKDRKRAEEDKKCRNSTGKAINAHVLRDFSTRALDGKSPCRNDVLAERLQAA